MSEIIVISVISAVLFIFSIFLLSGRGTFLIAGFNTMSKEQKARYDVNGLCRLIGTITMLFAITTPFLMIESILDWYVWVYLAFVIVLCVIAVYLANTKYRV